MTRKQEIEKDNNRKSDNIIQGALFGGPDSPFRPPLARQHQQQMNGRTNHNNSSNSNNSNINNNNNSNSNSNSHNNNIINHNEGELAVDMKDVFQSRSQVDRGDDRARIGTAANSVNHLTHTQTVSLREQRIGNHANRTSRPHIPQQHNRHHPARRSFTFVKEMLPASSGDDAYSIPSMVDDDDGAVQQSRHATLPITSQYIQMTRHFQLPPSKDKNKAKDKDKTLLPSEKSLYRLLLVDESDLLATALRLDGHHCDEVKDVSTAMALLHDTAINDVDLSSNSSVRYDAIILAARDGPSICKSIRARCPHVTIFGVTNTIYFREETRLFKAYGATSVLVKPFDMAFFMDFLRQMEELEMGNQSTNRV